LGSFSKFTFLVGAFIIVTGAVLLLNNLGITDISTDLLFANFWALLLIVGGLDILLVLIYCAEPWVLRAVVLQF